MRLCMCAPAENSERGRTKTKLLFFSGKNRLVRNQMNNTYIKSIFSRRNDCVSTYIVIFVLHLEFSKF